MASPDFSQYIDLTVYDEQPVTLYNQALEYARIALPEWTPITGSIEDAILQGVAQMAGYAAASINRLPDAMAEVLLELFGISRLTGVAATGTAAFTFVDGDPHTVPVGTRIGYSYVDGDDTQFYVFETTTAGSGTASVTVNIEALALVTHPEITSGTTMRLITPVSFVSTVSMASDLEVGSGPEVSADYIARAIARLSSYSSALVVPSQFDAYIATTYPDIKRVKTYSRLNPTNNSTDPLVDPPENGFITIYTCGLNGASFAASFATPILDAVESRAQAGLDINIENATVIDFDVEIEYALVDGYIQGTVEDAIETALNTYMHPDYWNWDTTIYYNDLVKLVSNVAGVDHVVQITIDTPADVTATGWSNLDRSFDFYGCLPRIPTGNLTFVVA